MNLVASLLPALNVRTDIDVASKKRLFEMAGQVFESGQHLAPATVFDSLFSREKLGSTGLGHGIAIPHGRIKGLKDAVGALFRLTQPIDFDAPDGQPVSLIFVLLVPAQATDQHLTILGELAQMFSEREVREAMLKASDSEALRRVVENWQP